MPDTFVAEVLKGDVFFKTVAYIFLKIGLNLPDNLSRKERRNGTDS